MRNFRLSLVLLVACVALLLGTNASRSAAQTAVVTPAATSTATATAATNAATAPVAPVIDMTPLSAPFAYGVASGAATNTSAVLWTRTVAATSVTPELSTTADFAAPTALAAVQTSDAADFTVHVAATGLQPGTRYYYRFKAGADVSVVGTFKTAYAPDQNATVTMAFSGDADWKWKPYPLLNSLVKENLDYYFFLGDLIYETTNIDGTTAVEDLAGYRYKYRENRTPRANSASGVVPMRDLYANFGQYSVFDNHETGPSKADKTAPPYNDGGVTVGGGFVNQTPGFKARIQAFAEYQPVTPETVNGTGDPRSDQTSKFYRSIAWGANQQLIILDDRSYRDARLKSNEDTAATSCSRTMLGAPQLTWFENELVTAQQRKVAWKVVVISSPMQELGRASQTGVDLDGTKSWAGGYACERNKLLKFIDDNEIENVVFLTTDNHYTVINNLSYNTMPDDLKSPLKPARNAFEVLTGPIGAGAGLPGGLKLDTKGMAIRDVDTQILGILNGDLPGVNGQTKGLKLAGLDPIGLEATFPGLDVASVTATGVQPGTLSATAFGSFQTFSYALLTFTQTTLTVQIKGLPYVADPSTLLNADAEKEYESRQAAPTLSFTVKAQ